MAKMVAITTIAMISVCHQFEKLNSANNFPQLVTPGGIPAPIKDNVDSITMVADKPKVKYTTIKPKVLGRACLQNITRGF